MKMLRYLLTLLLVMGMMAPTYARFSSEDAELKARCEEHNAHARKMLEDPKVSWEEKARYFESDSEFFFKGQVCAEWYVDWFVEGIREAIGATPLVVRDSIPNGMMNADIPEFLVRQLMNIQAIKRTQDEVVGTPKAPPVLYLGIKLTGEEAKRLTNSDDMINFVINHEDRVFFQVQK